MKRASRAVFAALLGSMIAAPVFAQTATGVQIPYEGANAPAAPGFGKHHPYARAFNGYLDAHPNEAADLSKNPRLADNPNYLASHPDLQSYLRAHPQVAARYKRHPEEFMHRERRYEHRERRYEHKEERYEKRHHLPPTN